MSKAVQTAMEEQDDKDLESGIDREVQDLEAMRPQPETTVVDPWEQALEPAAPGETTDPRPTIMVEAEETDDEIVVRFNKKVLNGQYRKGLTSTKGKPFVTVVHRANIKFAFDIERANGSIRKFAANGFNVTVNAY